MLINSLILALFLLGTLKLSAAEIQSTENTIGVYPNIPLLSILTCSELTEHFEYVDRIGGGGEAVVFKVKSRATNEFYALRICGAMRQLNLYGNTEFFHRMIATQNDNPHVEKIYSAFWLINKNYPFFGAEKKGVSPFGGYSSRLPEGKFICNDFADDPDAQIYHHEVTVVSFEVGV
jgi:hypothetical protein